jgi:transcriptional regulator with XRE-family HTH domain
MPIAAKTLRSLRQERDLSPADVAGEVSIAVGTLRNIENQSTTASWRVLHRFARFFNVDVNTLVDNEATETRGAA